MSGSTGSNLPGVDVAKWPLLTMGTLQCSCLILSGYSMSNVCMSGKLWLVVIKAVDHTD